LQVIWKEQRIDEKLLHSHSTNYAKKYQLNVEIFLTKEKEIKKLYNRKR